MAQLWKNIGSAFVLIKEVDVHHTQNSQFSIFPPPTIGEEQRHSIVYPIPGILPIDLLIFLDKPRKFRVLNLDRLVGTVI